MLKNLANLLFLLQPTTAQLCIKTVSLYIIYNIDTVVIYNYTFLGYNKNNNRCKVHPLK